MKHNVASSIARMREARSIHAYWVKRILAGQVSRTHIRIGGGLRHHRRWVKIYEAVIRLLQILGRSDEG